MQRIPLLTVACLFFLLRVQGQVCCPYPDEIKIIPELPTASDNIYLFTQVTLPEDGDIITSEYNDNDTLKVIQCYHWCCLQSTPSVQDTVLLGTFANGTHTINVRMYKSGSASSCSSESLSLDTAISFEVSEANGTNDISTNNEIRIYPNPIVKTLTINCTSIMHQIDIFNAQGVLTNREIDLNTSMIDIQLEGLQNGLYFLRIITEKKAVTKRIVKTN